MTKVNQQKLQFPKLALDQHLLVLTKVRSAKQTPATPTESDGELQTKRMFTVGQGWFSSTVPCPWVKTKIP